MHLTKSRITQTGSTQDRSNPLSPLRRNLIRTATSDHFRRDSRPTRSIRKRHELKFKALVSAFGIFGLAILFISAKSSYAQDDWEYDRWVQEQGEAEWAENHTLDTHYEGVEPRLENDFFYEDECNAAPEEPARETVRLVSSTEEEAGRCESFCNDGRNDIEDRFTGDLLDGELDLWQEGCVVACAEGLASPPASPTGALGAFAMFPWPIGPPSGIQTCCEFKSGNSIWRETVTSRTNDYTPFDEASNCENRAVGFGIATAWEVLRAWPNPCEVYSSSRFYVCARPVSVDGLNDSEQCIVEGCNASHVDIGVSHRGEIVEARSGRGGHGACDDENGTKCPMTVVSWGLRPNAGDAIRYGDVGLALKYGNVGKSCARASSQEIVECLRKAPQKSGPFNDLSNNCQVDIRRAADACCVWVGDCITLLPTAANPLEPLLP